MSSSGRVIRTVDVVLLLWVGLWIWMGVAIANEVSHLTDLSDTVVTAGQAVRTTGQALKNLEGVPFVGDRIADVDRQITAAGDAAVASGTQSRESIRHLSLLLGLSVAIMPSIPVLAVYVPFRASRYLDVRTIRRAVRRSADDPSFEEFLARRAAQHLPYHRLREISPNPWRDLEEGRFGLLARAELARLGLDRLAGRLPDSSSPSGTTSPPRAVTG